MAVKSAAPAEAPGVERTEQLLVAACRVLTRGGSRGLSLKDVAEEANVSKTLIHYYFSSRDDLLVKAYEFADRRGRERVRQLLPERGTAVERLARLLSLYLGDESDINQDWVLWTELSAAAIFEPDLRPVMNRSFQRWSEWIESLVRDAVLEGSLEAETDTRATALRLIALVEGLGSLLVRELIGHAAALAALDTVLAQELGFADSTSDPAAGDHVRPSSTYLRHLAAVTRQAVEGLDLVADSSEETAALRAVEALIDRAAGRPASASRPDRRDAGES